MTERAFRVEIDAMPFIVFEGLDGSGKSSLLRALEDELKGRGVSFHRTREPGGTELGEEIREIILRKTPPNPGPKAELLLYQAARAQHVDEVIRPRLLAGEWVISDRFSASSVAFQAGGRAIAQADVEWLSRFATGDLQADLTVLLDLSVDEARRRQGRREDAGGEGADRIESESEAFHQRVRESFLDQARRAPDSWLLLSAEKTPEVLREELFAELRRRGWLD